MSATIKCRIIVAPGGKIAVAVLSETSARPTYTFAIDETHAVCLAGNGAVMPAIGPKDSPPWPAGGSGHWGTPAAPASRKERRF